MKTIKHPIMTLLFACCFVAVFLSPAQATFPGLDIAHWDSSVSTDNTDPQYLTVQDLVREKEYDAALVILNQKAKNKSDRGTALVLKAIILNEQGKYLQALSVMHLGEMVQRRHPSVLFGFCQIYRNLGQAEPSRRACVVATQQHFNNPLVHYEFAQTLMALGEMKEASRELAIAAEHDPKSSRYHYQRGLIFSYFNDANRAEKAFQKALSVDPDDLDSAYQLAYAYAINKKSEKAKKYISQILRTKGQHPKAGSTRALRDYINRNAEDKLPAKVIPSDYHLSRSQSFYKSGKYGLALLEIQTAARLKPDAQNIQEILAGLSSILLRLDIAEKAVNHLIGLTKANPTLQARGYQKLGDINVIQGKLDSARKNYEKALSQGDPQNLAKIALEELPKQAKGDPQSLIRPNEIFIDPVEGLNRQGEIFAHYGMYKSALGVYSLILKMNPSHLMTKLNAGTAYFRSGQYDRAVALLEKILVSHPNHDNIDVHRFLLAKAYAKKGDLTSSLSNLEQLVELNPGFKETIQSEPEFKKLRDLERYKKLFQ